MHSSIRDAASTDSSASFTKRTRLAAAFGLALLATTVMTPVQAFADEKIALVVGNSQYRKVTRLTNPANDSTDVAASLRRLGFNVKHLMDLDFDGFRRAIIDFGNEAKTADMAVIFYAGHGAEIDGKNWLIPVDAEIKSEINVYAEAINLEMLIDISVMPKVVGLIVLDACRNNPFVETIAAGRSIVATNRATLSGPTYSAASIPAAKSNAPAAAPVELVKSTDGAVPPAEPLEPPGHGLAPVEPADNVLVAFAAAAGTTANDGTGRNSPYSSALLRHVETPGLEINYLFRNVHDDVIEETKQQQPALYGTLSKDEIFFRPGDERAVAAYNDQEAEKLAWPYIRATNDINVLRKFVEQFPASARLGEVNARIAQLEGAEKFAWTIVERQNTASAYRAFTELYPYSERTETARTMMASLDTG
ncbi:MAG: caspase family protein [Hyphomicrobiales bacterium]